MLIKQNILVSWVEYSANNIYFKCKQVVAKHAEPLHFADGQREGDTKLEWTKTKTKDFISTDFGQAKNINCCIGEPKLKTLYFGQAKKKKITALEIDISSAFEGKIQSLRK